MPLGLVAAVILAYLVVFALGFAGIAATWLVLGAEGAFQEGTTVASVPWSVINLALVGPIWAVGGLVAGRVAKDRARPAVRALAVLALGIGLVLAMAGLGADAMPLPEGKDVSDLTFFEAGGIASNPTWYAFLAPLLGALGAMAGGRMARPAED